eukprot:gene8068-1310_t
MATHQPTAQVKRQEEPTSLKTLTMMVPTPHLQPPDPSPQGEETCSPSIRERLISAGKQQVGPGHMGKIADALRYAWRKADKFLSVDCNPDPISLARFRSTKDVATWNVFTDSTFGGNSKAVLELGEGSKTALFTGRYSKLVNEGSQLVRSGYAGFNTVYNRNSDLSLHDYLDVRLRGDGSTYIISMRLDQLSGGDEDAWQAPLVTKR